MLVPMRTMEVGLIPTGTVVINSKVDALIMATVLSIP